MKEGKKERERETDSQLASEVGGSGEKKRNLSRDRVIDRLTETERDR